MTSESKAKTEPWVAKHKAGYPYAYDSGGRLMGFFGVSGIPHAVLVAPTGEVVWRGHPAELTPSTIESALGGALRTPVWEWPDAAKHVRAAVREGAWAKALRAAEQLPPEHQDVLAAVRRLIEQRVQGLKAAHEAGNLLDARALAQRLEKQLQGLPEAQQAAELAAAIEASPKTEAILAAQRTVRGLWSTNPRERDEVAAAAATLRRIQQEHAGTRAAREAKELIERLEPRR